MDFSLKNWAIEAPLFSCYDGARRRRLRPESHPFAGSLPPQVHQGGGRAVALPCSKVWDEMLGSSISLHGEQERAPVQGQIQELPGWQLQQGSVDSRRGRNNLQAVL